jgi:hypothetical protein
LGLLLLLLLRVVLVGSSTPWEQLWRQGAAKATTTAAAL